MKDYNKLNTTLVTPEMAKEFLKLNTVNRPIRKSHFDSMVGDILRGDWIPTHQGIAFNINNEMVDGQHRCMAIIEANTPAEVTITTGLPIEAYKVLDSGAKRNNSDLLHIDKRRVDIAGYISRIIVQKKPTVFQVEKIYTNFEDEIGYLMDSCGTTTRTFSTLPIRTAATMRIKLSPNNADYIVDLYSDLVKFNLTNLPSVARSFIKQCHGRTYSATKYYDLFSRAMVLFDIEKKDTKNILIPDVSVYLDIVKSNFGYILKNKTISV